MIPGSLRSGAPTLSTGSGSHAMYGMVQSTPTPQPCGACSGDTGNPFGYGGPKPIPSLPPCVQTISCVATAPTSAPSGGRCDSSPANNAVGTGNLGKGTTWGTTIANVYGFVNSNNTVVYGWAYQTENENMFFQTNGASMGIGTILSFFQNVPGLSGIADALVAATSGPYQITGQQWQNIQQSMQQSSFKLHRCWATNYTGGGGANA